MFVGVICTAIYWIYWPCIWPGFLLAARVIVRHCPAKLPLADYKSGWVLKPFGFPVHSLRIPVNTLYHHGFWNPYYCSNINYSKNLDVAIHIYIYTNTHTWIHIVYTYNILYIHVLYQSWLLLRGGASTSKAWPLGHGSEMNLRQNTSDACVVLPQAVQHVDVNEPPHRP